MLPAGILWHGYTTFYSLVNGNLGYFWFEGIINKYAITCFTRLMCMHVCVCLWTHIFSFLWINMQDWSVDHSVDICLIFLGNYQGVHQKAVPFYSPSSNLWEVWLSSPKFGTKALLKFSYSPKGTKGKHLCINDFFTNTDLDDNYRFKIVNILKVMYINNCSHSLIV